MLANPLNMSCNPSEHSQPKKPMLPCPKTSQFLLPKVEESSPASNSRSSPESLSESPSRTTSPCNFFQNNTFQNTLQNTHAVSTANISLPPLILPPISPDYSSGRTSALTHLPSFSLPPAKKIRLPSVDKTLPELYGIWDEKNGSYNLRKCYSTDNILPHSTPKSIHSIVSSPLLASSSLSSHPSSKSSSAPEFMAKSLAETSPVLTSSESINKPKATPRKRKKRQCPDCLKLVSNLATHKSTHIAHDSKPHICQVCSRGFTRLNDLSRHKKRHWKDNYESMELDHDNSTETETVMPAGQGQIFKCPYWDHDAPLTAHPHSRHHHDEKHHDNANDNAYQLASRCHQTGVFSRGDTFKNHLKALHFTYPEGTKKKERASVSGECSKCGEHFTTVDSWLNNHVLNNICPGIINQCTFTLESKGTRHI